MCVRVVSALYCVNLKKSLFPFVGVGSDSKVIVRWRATSGGGRVWPMVKFGRWTDGGRNEPIFSI
jgi:hypothetical protein